MIPTTLETEAAQRFALALVEFLAAVNEANEVRSRLRQRPSALSPEMYHGGFGSSGEKRDRVPVERLLLNSREAARYLSIGQRLLWSMSQPRGPIPVVRLGTAVRYRVSDLNAAIAEMQTRNGGRNEN